MPKFRITYGATFDDGLEKSVKTQIHGSVVVEGENIERARAIARCISGTEIYAHEYLSVKTVELCADDAEVTSVEDMRFVVNPYRVTENGRYAAEYHELRDRIERIDPALVSFLLS